MDGTISNKISTKIISITVGVLFLLLVLSPAWFDGGDFGTSDGILFLGWLGIMIGIPSWYWFLGFFILISSLKSGSFFVWTKLKKSLLTFFFVACSVTVLAIVQVGKITPGDVDCQCQKITEIGPGYYLYQVLIWYLISVIVLLSLTNKDSVSQNQVIKTLSIITLVIAFAFVFLNYDVIFSHWLS